MLAVLHLKLCTRSLTVQLTRTHGSVVFLRAEWLYSPADEIARNGNVIDWDCPNLRYRRDPVRCAFGVVILFTQYCTRADRHDSTQISLPPFSFSCLFLSLTHLSVTFHRLVPAQTEPSVVKRCGQAIAYNCSKCFINFSGLVYFMLSQRKNLSA